MKYVYMYTFVTSTIITILSGIVSLVFTILTSTKLVPSETLELPNNINLYILNIAAVILVVSGLLYYHRKRKEMKNN